MLAFFIHFFYIYLAIADNAHYIN